MRARQNAPPAYHRVFKKFDVIIIGGGHRGLVCAAYLARAGRKVLVLVFESPRT